MQEKFFKQIILYIFAISGISILKSKNENKDFKSLG